MSFVSDNMITVQTQRVGDSQANGAGVFRHIICKARDRFWGDDKWCFVLSKQPWVDLFIANMLY